MKFNAYSGRELHAAKAIIVSAQAEGLTYEELLMQLEDYIRPRKPIVTESVPDKIKHECPKCGHNQYIARRGSDLPMTHPDQEWIRDCLKCGFSKYIGKKEWPTILQP